MELLIINVVDLWYEVNIFDYHNRKKVQHILSGTTNQVKHTECYFRSTLYDDMYIAYEA